MKVLSDGYVMCYVCFVFHICFYPEPKLCLHFLRSIKKSDNDQIDHYQIYKIINFNTATLSEWSLWPLWLMDTLSLFLFYIPHNRSTINNAAVHTTILCDIVVFCHTKQNNVIIFCKYCATYSTLPRMWKCFQKRLQDSPSCRVSPSQHWKQIISLLHQLGAVMSPNISRSRKQLSFQWDIFSSCSDNRAL